MKSKLMKKTRAFFADMLKIAILWLLQILTGSAAAFVVWNWFMPYRLDYKTVFIGTLVLRTLLWKADEEKLADDTIMVILLSAIGLIIGAIMRLVW